MEMGMMVIRVMGVMVMMTMAEMVSVVVLRVEVETAGTMMMMLTAAVIMAMRV